jgi:hypothetical protein
MIEYMELGSTPCEEDCAQVGSNGFRERANNEMTAYINQLNRLFSNAESNGVKFRIKWFSHDFGSYGEVCAYWDTENEIANEYVYTIDRNLPSNWDKDALKELKII